MLPSETMIWQPEFTDKTLSRKTGAVQSSSADCSLFILSLHAFARHLAVKILLQIFLHKRGKV
ncbi:hypothetical protein [Escherichia coli]|uniref:hypothetical protein n=1 Tax=Escherichia coli TaxID=562 RepID=UPI000BDF5294|nr:hypothetical protein [Escherichia coli]